MADSPAADALRRLREALAGQTDAPLGVIIDHLGEQGQGLLLLLLGLASLVPGPAPLFGAALCAVGLGLALGRTQLSLPNWVRRRPIPTARAIKMVDRLMPFITRVARPRAPRFLRGGSLRLAGASCIVDGVLIILPIPLGNAGPAFSVLGIALGVVAGDGAIVVAGLVGTVLSVAFSVFLVGVGFEAVMYLLRGH